MGSGGLGHMTKMAAMPIYGKNLLWNQRASDLRAWYATSGAQQSFFQIMTLG